MIALDSSTYYQLARKAVLDEQYDKAVGYFIKAGDYHSQINAVVLLFFMDEYFLAHQQYLMLYVQFNATHNVNADMLWAMKGGEKYSRKWLVGKSNKRERGKQSATTSKLFQFGVLNALSAGEPTLDSTIQSLLDHADDLDQDQSSPRPIFALLNSPEYYLMIIQKMQEAFVNGNEELGNKYATELIERDSDVIVHLELKLVLLLSQGKTQQAYQLAQRLQTHPQLSTPAKFVIAEVFYLQGDTQALDEFLQSMPLDEDYDEVEWNKLVNYATSVRNYDLALAFANKIPLDDFYDVNANSLITSAIAFYNANQTQRAIHNLKRLRRALPNVDAFKALLNYFVDNNQPVVKLTTALPGRMLCPYQLPSLVADKSLSALQKGCSVDDFVHHLKVLTYAENGYYMGINKTTYGKQIVNLFTSTTQPTNDNLANFMQQSLLNTFTSPRVKSAFLFHLTTSTQAEITLVTESGYNVITQGMFDGVSKQQRLVLCAIATMTKLKDIDVQKAVQAYNEMDDQSKEQDVFVVAENLITSLTASC